MTNTDVMEILYVEDDANVADLMRRALQKQHLANHALVVEDGAEALEFIFAGGAYAGRTIENRPKMILLDLALPKVGGLEVLRRIKSDERTKNIPVVIWTSSQEERDVAESYRCGANSYIVKPINFQKFQDTVSKICLYWLSLNKSSL